VIQSKKRILIHSLLAIVGALIWFIATYVANGREPWDSNYFGTIVIPAMLVINLVAGFFDPERIVLKGIISISLQPIIMILVAGEIGSMFPLGVLLLVMFGVMYSGGGVVGKVLNKLTKKS